MKEVDHAATAATELGRGLAPLVAWAIRAALGWAQAKGLPEDDLVSEAVHAVAAAVRTYAGGTTLSDHVRRRVRGALLDATKKERRRRTREVLFDDLEEAQRPGAGDEGETLALALGVEAQVLGSPEESMLRREARAALDREVEKLQGHDRRLYDLRHREGLTWPEIAAETGMPESTARWHDTRIRGHLTAELRAYRDDG